MVWMRKSALWIKKHWKWLAGSVAVLISTFGLYSIRKNLKDYCIQKQKVFLKKKKRDIEVLKAKKELIEANINYTEDQIEDVDVLIKEIDESIDNMNSEISKLTRSEKLDKFDELGY